MMYCQKCRTPLKLDASLENLNPASFDLLVGSTGKPIPLGDPVQLDYPRERKRIYDQAKATTHSPTYKRTIPAPLHLESRNAGNEVQQARPDMSFIDITESQIVPANETKQRETRKHDASNTKATNGDNEEDPAPLSCEMQRHEWMFSILSSHSDIDHPVCTECTSLLLSSFNARLASSSRERDAYASFLKSLQSGSTISSAEDVAKAEQELAAALKKEEAAFEELRKLEEEKIVLEAEIADLEELHRAVDVEEVSFWASRNAFEEHIHDLSVDLLSLQQRHAHDHQQLERLQRTNVYNDTFCIGHDGYFGTINGLRLGRLPGQNVEWSEINAAWGQTLLLLATIAERLGHRFREYRLRPLGSTSRIDKLDWPQQIPNTPARAATEIRQPPKPQPKISPLDLFSSGDIPIGRVFYHRRFDAGMVAFLDCLSQVGNFVEKTASDISPSLARTNSRSTPAHHRVLPYPINGDKIGDPAIGQAVSIKLGAGFKQDESWTKACKYALTCCKYLLAHVSNLENARERRE